MEWIATFIKSPVKVTVIVILILLFGVIALAKMPVQLVPNVEPPVITIETRWPGASPEEVEREIVQEQEEQLKSVEGVVKMGSESQDSRGQITLEFTVGTDMEAALVMVNTRLGQVREYPADADEPVISTSNLADRPIAWFVLIPRPPTRQELDDFVARHPEHAALMEPVQKAHNNGLLVMRLLNLARAHPEIECLKEIAPPDTDIPKLKTFCEDIIESRLERVDGVSQCNVIGGEDEEMQVIVDPHRLAARRITIGELRRALLAQNRDTSAGELNEGKRRWVIRTLGQFRSAEQIERTIIARREGKPVYVRDVATVVLGHKKPTDLTQRFGGLSIALNCNRAMGSNVLDVMSGLREACAELNESVLEPRGLLLEQVYDETDYIYSAIDLVTENIVAGAVLTFITLLIFLKSARSTLVIGAHILISTVGAFLALWLCGRTLNVPALGGLAFAVGMLVDNAIVMLENIYRRHQMGEDVMTASVRGAKEVWGALLNASLVNLAVFLPVLTIQQEVGQLFRDIAIAISAAVALSMVVAVIVVPTAGARLIAPPRPPRFALTRWISGLVSPILDWIKRVVLGPLDFVGGMFTQGVVGINDLLQRRAALRLVVCAVLILVPSALAWLMRPKVEYLPKGNRNLVIGLILPPPGYNIDKLVEVGRQIEGDLQPYWEARPGSPEAAKLDAPPIGDLFYVARNRNLFVGLRSGDPNDVSRLIPPLQRAASKIPGMHVVAKQSAMFEQGLAASGTVDIEISGPEIDTLVKHGAKIMTDVVAVLPQVGTGLAAQVRPIPSLDLKSPELHVTPRLEQAADMTLDATELGYSVNALVDGAYAGDYNRGGTKIDLTIMGQGRYAQRTQDLAQLPVATPTGDVVPLSALAEIAFTGGPEQINHRERQRAITIQVTPPAGMPLQEAIEIIEAKIVKPLLASPDFDAKHYRLGLSGTAEKLTDTWRALQWNILLAVLITYLLMAALFESWLYPLVIMTSVPLGAVGGILGLMALNLFARSPDEVQNLDMLTMLGFVMLVGTVVNNPILIVEQALIHMREEGMARRPAILEAVRNRIRPIFMTTLAGLIGLFPLVAGTGAGSELYRGIGAVLLGGMLLSTVFTLFLVPALLGLVLDFESMARRVLRRSPADEDEEYDRHRPFGEATEDPPNGAANGHTQREPPGELDRPGGPLGPRPGLPAAGHYDE